MKRLKDRLMVIVILVALVGGFIYSQIDAMEHIEDTNGPDDYSLAVITDEEIAAKGRKVCVGGPDTSRSKTTFLGVTTTSGTTYFSDCFSGIRLLDSWNIISGDLFFNLYGYEVTGGNFQMCIVHDGQVIATIEPTADGDVYFVMNDVDPGVYDLYIAGESAAFEFMSTDFDDEV